MFFFLACVSVFVLFLVVRTLRPKKPLSQAERLEIVREFCGIDAILASARAQSASASQAALSTEGRILN